MNASDQSCSIDSLLEQSEKMRDLAPALGYLTFYGWIGVSQETLHVWLSGEARSLLQQASQRLQA